MSRFIHCQFQTAHRTIACASTAHCALHSLSYTGSMRPHTRTCTLAKSTRLRSLSIWLICAVFCSTARAAWARWFREVYLRSVCAKAFAHVTYINRRKKKTIINTECQYLSAGAQRRGKVLFNLWVHLKVSF